MKEAKRYLIAVTIGIGLTLLAAAPQPACGTAFFGPDQYYGDLRGVVDRTQSDLRSALDLEHGKKQDQRYRNAQDRLSDFDRSLAKGHFDKGRLNKAIDDLQHLLDHNTLQAGNRDALRRDVEDLRIARERRGH